MRIAISILIAACGNPSFPIASDCNPLGANHCLTPWPSAVFEVDDATSAVPRQGPSTAGDVRRTTTSPRSGATSSCVHE